MGIKMIDSKALSLKNLQKVKPGTKKVKAMAVRRAALMETSDSRSINSKAAKSQYPFKALKNILLLDLFSSRGT